jgi:hypothetical protein
MLRRSRMSDEGSDTSRRRSRPRRPSPPFPHLGPPRGNATSRKSEGMAAATGRTLTAVCAVVRTATVRRLEGAARLSRAGRRWAAGRAGRSAFRCGFGKGAGVTTSEKDASSSASKARRFTSSPPLAGGGRPATGRRAAPPGRRPAGRAVRLPQSHREPGRRRVRRLPPSRGEDRGRGAAWVGRPLPILGPIPRRAARRVLNCLMEAKGAAGGFLLPGAGGETSPPRAVSAPV